MLQTEISWLLFRDQDRDHKIQSEQQQQQQVATLMLTTDRIAAVGHAREQCGNGRCQASTDQ